VFVRQQEVAAVPEGLDVKLLDTRAAGVLDQFMLGGVGQAVGLPGLLSPRWCGHFGAVKRAFWVAW